MNTRRRGRIEGIVQGIGFRPFLLRLARELGLGGRAFNEGAAVVVEVEGARHAVEAFEERIRGETPPSSRIDAIAWETQDPLGEPTFHITASEEAASRSVSIPPDLAVCDECRAETRDPAARRHLYPFTNCTRCGPRFTIVESLPYDRPRTSMAGFTMCPECRREYADPADRRYHAQPIACPACGPQLGLRDVGGEHLEGGEGAIERTVEALRRGRIVAVKGLGGFQLLVDARDEKAVQRLRRRKRREEKPLAVMVADLEAARRRVRVGAVEEEILLSRAAPIVLCDRAGDDLAPSIAPGNPRLGVFLPTTPLHGRILEAVGFPVVATSGNLHEEPIAKDDDEAVRRLAGVADLFLVHDRPIVRRCDDAVVHVVGGVARTLRLARGLAPLSMPLRVDAPPLLAVGSHWKHAPAGFLGGQAIVWPHVGDLDPPLARQAMEQALGDLRHFLDLRPRAVAADLHPDYAPTRWAEASGIPVTKVQHHHAHVAACLAEHGLDQGLGVAWDGVGLGTDGAAWGGEFLRVEGATFQRVAHLRSFPLPGGDEAARDGRRALAGASVAGDLDLDLDDPDFRAFVRLARDGTRLPAATSAGRLFDAVAALLGIRARSTFEGQAAMEVEFAALAHGTFPPEPYPYRLEGEVVDWAPMLRAMARERDDAPRAAARFHATLVQMILDVARREGARVVALGGGCFQNRVLAGWALETLEAEGIRPLLPSRLPPGDGGLAVGQLWVAGHRLAGRAVEEWPSVELLADDGPPRLARA